LINKLRKEIEMRMTGSQIDQEVAGVVAPQLGAVGTTNLETPPTQELPVQPASAPPAVPEPTHHRYRALAAAVRHHELVSSHPAIPKRPADHALYGVLDGLESVRAIPADRARV
jgi:hypothetical protein